ncbi:MAG: hypothetical protein JRJ37_11070, partial [Deltaproteobacteria bacterium]|nr:hypothetical protein [Deltaproteobacteria bacterium]
LDNLAEILRQRPGLVLEIEGVAHKKADWRILATSQLDKILNRMRAGRGESAESPDSKRTVSVDDELRILKRLYIKRFDNLPGTLPTDEKSAITDLRNRLLDSLVVDESTLRNIARQRALAVKEHLIKHSNIEDRRLHMLGAKIQDGVVGKSVRMALSLSGG